MVVGGWLRRDARGGGPGGGSSLSSVPAPQYRDRFKAYVRMALVADDAEPVT